MVRYLVVAAGMLAIMSGAAFAQTATVTTGDMGSKTVISKAGPEGIGHKRVVIKRHVNRYGNLVTKKKIMREGLAGSSVTRVRKSTNPETGITTKERSTELR